MKRTAHIDYVANNDRQQFLERVQRARNPVEVGVTVEVEKSDGGRLIVGDTMRIALQVYVDGSYELSRGGEIVHVGAVS